MSHFRITPRAREDLKNIGRYTERCWGKAQRNNYLKSLEKRFAWLADNPRLGKHRSDIQDGYYSFPQGEHVVFYLISQDGIDIIGIPHKEMDIISYFPTGESDFYDSPSD
jgi:toxin ParE1/3/4